LGKNERSPVSPYNGGEGKEKEKKKRKKRTDPRFDLLREKGNTIKQKKKQSSQKKGKKEGLMFFPRAKVNERRGKGREEKRGNSMASKGKREFPLSGKKTHCDPRRLQERKKRRRREEAVFDLCAPRVSKKEEKEHLMSEGEKEKKSRSPLQSFGGKRGGKSLCRKREGKAISRSLDVTKQEGKKKSATPSGSTIRTVPGRLPSPFPKEKKERGDLQSPAAAKRKIPEPTEKKKNGRGRKSPLIGAKARTNGK